MSRVPEELINKGLYWTKPWNPIRMEGGGFHCTKISEGCANCWAETMNLRGGGKPYDNREYRYEFAPGAKNIAKMKNEVVAVQWLGDLFHQDIPEVFINEVWQMLHEYDSNTYLVLTKRMDRFLWLAKKYCWAGFDHVFIGVTVESPKYLDRVEKLKQWQGKRFVSIEPCLTAVNLKGFTGFVDAVIIGSESGSSRRIPPSLQSLRYMINACLEHDCPVFVKQWELDGRFFKMPEIFGRRWDQLPW